MTDTQHKRIIDMAHEANICRMHIRELVAMLHRTHATAGQIDRARAILSYHHGADYDVDTIGMLKAKHGIGLGDAA